MLVAKAGGGWGEGGGREIIAVGWNNKQVQTSDRGNLTIVNVVLDGKHCDV